jgi:hypothetical protein
VARSTDDGQTWSEPKPAFSEPLAGGLKPTVVQFGTTLKSGRIVLAGSFGTTASQPNTTSRHQTLEISPYGFPVVEIRGRWKGPGECRVLLSDDDGRTWRATGRVDVLDYVPGGHIAQMSGGSLVLPVYGYRHGAPDGESLSNGFVVSKDRGETWSEATIVAAFDKRLHDMPSEMSIVELADGRWVAIYRNQFHRDDHNSGGTYMYRAYSNDQGKTWTTGQQIFASAGYTVAGLLPDGALIVVCNSSHIVYRVSNNGGRTWDYENKIWGRDPRSGGDNGGYGMLNLADGRVLIAYYGKADRSKRIGAYSYGKMRLEVATLKKVKADSVEGRMR